MRARPGQHGAQLCLIAALLFLNACSSTPSAPASEAFSLDIAVVASGQSFLDVEQCAATLRDAFEDRGLSLVKVSPQVPHMSLTLEHAEILLESDADWLSQTVAWIFLGPIYWWIPEATYELKYTARIETKRPGQRAIQWQGSPLTYRRTLNFHNWNGQFHWYVISLFLPPVWATTDGEEVTEALFARKSRQLSQLIRDQLEASRRSRP